MAFYFVMATVLCQIIRYLVKLGDLVSTSKESQNFSQTFKWKKQILLDEPEKHLLGKGYLRNTKGHYTKWIILPVYRTLHRLKTSILNNAQQNKNSAIHFWYFLQAFHNFSFIMKIALR